MRSCVVYVKILQNRCSNLHLLHCHSTKWRFDWLISSCIVCVGLSGPEWVCVVAKIFMLNAHKLASKLDSTVEFCNLPLDSKMLSLSNFDALHNRMSAV